MGRLDKKWWPMQEFQGRTMDGGVESQPVFIDTTTFHASHQRIAHPEDGWSGAPPNEASGAPEREQTERTAFAEYRRRYDLIDWTVGRRARLCDSVEAPWVPSDGVELP